VTGLELGLLSVVAMLVLIYCGMYIPMVLTLISFVGVWLMRDSFDLATNLLRISVTESLANYVFAFVLMGLLVSIADLGKDTFEVADRIFRKVKGGLGVATVAASAVFAAITGISIASAAVFTKVAVPEMLRTGYTARFAVGVVAGSSILGMLIPPSLLFIIYGLLTETSIGHLFIAGIVPGIVLAVAYAVCIIFMAHRFPRYVVGQGDATRPAEARMGFLTAVEKTLPVVLLVIAVLGGIYGGAFTPTEAGAVGALGALILALAKRRLNGNQFWSMLMETGVITASICFLIVGATMYSKMLALAGVPQQLGDWMVGTGFGFYGFLAIYVVIILILGTIIDSVSIMLIVLPLVLPVLKSLGVDLVWFGVITVVAVEIGLLTPPFGLSVFAIKATLSDDRIALNDIFMGALPFAAIMVGVLVILIAMPRLSTILL
jgi:tripartite ATP-independent transporter DctM subunit